MVSTDLTVWITAILTLFAFSFVVKSTILFKIAEYTAIGVGMGNTIVMAWKSLQTSSITPLLSGDIAILIPILFGVMVFASITRNYAWVSKYPTSWMVAVGVGLAVRTTVVSPVLLNVKALIQPFTTTLSATQFLTAAFILVSFIASLSYFIFTLKQGKGLAASSRFGRILIMAYFGSTFGGHTGTRLLFIIGRLQFLLFDWLGLG